jgi:hypothetical protein
MAPYGIRSQLFDFTDRALTLTRRWFRFPEAAIDLPVGLEVLRSRRRRFSMKSDRTSLLQHGSAFLH